MRTGLTPSTVQWCRCGRFRGRNLADSVAVRRRFRAGVGVFCQTLVTTSMFAGHFREAYELTNNWNGSNPERPYSPHQPVEAILDAIDREVFTEAHLQEVLAIAHETLRSSKIRTSRVEVHSDEHEPDSFLYECFVVASPEKAEDLNEALDAQIRDCPHLMDDPGLQFMPAFIGASMDGSQPETAT